MTDVKHENDLALSSKRFDTAFLFQNLFQRKLPVSQIVRMKIHAYFGKSSFRDLQRVKFGKILKVSEHGKSRPIQRLIIWPVNHAQNLRPNGLKKPGPEKIFFLQWGQVMLYMILGKVRQERSLILMDRLVSDIFSKV